MYIIVVFADQRRAAPRARGETIRGTQLKLNNNMYIIVVVADQRRAAPRARGETIRGTLL